MVVCKRRCKLVPWGCLFWASKSTPTEVNHDFLRALMAHMLRSRKDSQFAPINFLVLIQDLIHVLILNRVPIRLVCINHALKLRETNISRKSLFRRCILVLLLKRGNYNRLNLRHQIRLLILPTIGWRPTNHSRIVIHILQLLLPITIKPILQDRCLIHAHISRLLVIAQLLLFLISHENHRLLDIFHSFAHFHVIIISLLMPLLLLLELLTVLMLVMLVFLLRWVDIWSCLRLRDWVKLVLVGIVVLSEWKSLEGPILLWLEAFVIVVGA